VKPLRVGNIGGSTGASFGLLRDLDFVSYSENSPAENGLLLQSGAVDLALISVSDYSRFGGYIGLNYGIAWSGTAGALHLTHVGELNQVQRVYCSAEAWSAALHLRVLLQDRWNLRPRLIPPSGWIGLESLCQGEAVLQMEQEREPDETSLNLVAAWNEWTGQPLILYLWALRPGFLTLSEYQRLEEVFYLCTVGGKLAEEESSLRCKLDDELVQGLNCFYGTCASRRLLPPTQFQVARYNVIERRPVLSPRKSVSEILSTVLEGQRLSVADAVRLAEDASLGDLAILSEALSESSNAKRHLNISMSIQVEKALGQGEALKLNAPEPCVSCILLSPPYGALDSLEVYEGLVHQLKSLWNIRLEGFGVQQLMTLSERSGVPLDEVIARLITAGLDIVPSWGGEMLCVSEKGERGEFLISAEDWLSTMQRVHRYGGATVGAMRIHEEDSWESRMLHLDRLRALQDATGGMHFFALDADRKRWSVDPETHIRSGILAQFFLDNVSMVFEERLNSEDCVGFVGLCCGSNSARIVISEEAQQELNELLRTMHLMWENRLAFDVITVPEQITSAVN
jgi:2-iminoacetate synthase ThiH